MTQDNQQALDMAIMDILIEFRTGEIALPQAMIELKAAFDCYSNPCN